MKKIITVFVLSMILFIVGCVAKFETTTFKQSPITGAEVSIIVEHKGDKVKKVSAKDVFDNEKLQITDESVADQVVDDFKTSSNLKNVKIKYTEKETVITYSAPKEYVKSGENYKNVEKTLESTGFFNE